MKDLLQEEKELLQDLSLKSAQPDPKFKQSLKFKTVKEYSSKSIFGNISFALLTTAILSLSVIIIGSTILLTTTPTVQTINTNFSKEEKESIYSNIIKNNPISIVKTSVNEPSKTQKISTTKEEIVKVQQSYTDKYYLAEFVTLTQKYSDQCIELKIENGSTTFTEFRDKERYFSKTISKDSNNKISYYNLTQVTGNKTVDYTFTGGSDVIKTTSTNIADGNQSNTLSYPISLPVSYTQNSAEEDFFNNDIVLEQVKKDGKDYYTLKTLSDSNCGNLNNISYPVSYGTKSKLTTISYFNASSFVLEFTEVYLNEVERPNLLYTESYLKREKQIDLTKVEREFEYDLTVPVAVEGKMPVSYTTPL